MQLCFQLGVDPQARLRLRAYVSPIFETDTIAL